MGKTVSGCVSGCRPLPGEQLVQVVWRRVPSAAGGRAWADGGGAPGQLGVGPGQLREGC